MKFQGPIPIRLITHNIRFSTAEPFEGEQPWCVRRYRIAGELRFNTTHNEETFVCLQEALHDQIYDILRSLNVDGDEWNYIGVGRDDGREAGEYSPILYRPRVWKMLECKTIWLSETPEKPSKSWDAASIRILTVGKFQHCRSKRVIIAMNTHLDDQGPKSRLEAAKIIAQQISSESYEANHVDLPLFLAGDFNSETNMEAYCYLKEHSPMADLHDLVTPNERYGHRDTFTGFGHENVPPVRIDFLFIRNDRTGDGDTLNPGDQWIVRNYGVLENKFDDGVYCSDHRAVAADLLLK